MRRFMQTFVLAPQSPKKYYVHNDIFRYQVRESLQVTLITVKSIENRSCIRFYFSLVRTKFSLTTKLEKME